MIPSKLSVLSALAVLCVHSVAVATQPSATSSAGSVAQVTSQGAMTIGNNGSALSFASSSQSAGVGTTATTFHTPSYSNVRASVSGETSTLSAGVAYNISKGAGTGWAGAAGSVSAATHAVVGIRGLNTGDSGGSAGTSSTFTIQAARNQGGSVQGNTASGFATELTFQRLGEAKSGNPAGGVVVNATTTGHVSGANASGALAGLNAAALVSIQSSGYFSGLGQLGAATGTITRP